MFIVVLERYLDNLSKISKHRNAIMIHMRILFHKPIASDIKNYVVSSAACKCRYCIPLLKNSMKTENLNHHYERIQPLTIPRYKLGF